MLQLPFSAAAVAVLVGAVIAGAAIGVMTAPPAEIPAMQASTGQAPAAVAAPPSEPAAETPSPPPKTEQTVVEQTVIEVAPAPNPAPLQPENVVQQTETTTVVAAPVIVTGLGIASGCAGCIEHRHDDKAHRPVARVDRPAPRREVVLPRVAFVRPPQFAAASAHRR